jgi:uncharacterized protein YggE
MIRFFHAVILSALLAGIANAQSESPQPRIPEIVTPGFGEVKLKPDRAELTIAVVTNSGSAAEAGRSNATRVSAVRAALLRQGVPDSSIATSGYAVELERNYGSPRAAADSLPRYIARNAVRISLRDLDALGRLIDTALVAGASEVSRLSFSSSAAASVRGRALEIAVQQARADAEIAARAAGGRLGRLLQLRITPDARALAYMMLEQSAYSAPEPTSINPTDISVRMSIEVRFEFLPRP